MWDFHILSRCVCVFSGYLSFQKHVLRSIREVLVNLPLFFLSAILLQQITRLHSILFSQTNKLHILSLASINLLFGPRQHPPTAIFTVPTLYMSQNYTKLSQSGLDL